MVAMDAIAEVIAEGLQKPPPEVWPTDNIRMHCLKGPRHLNTFSLMIDRYQKQAGENHLKLALYRVAMAITQLVDSEPRS